MEAELRRPLRGILMVLTVGIPVILAALWFARIPLAEAVVPWLIRHQGLPPVHFHITELETDRLTVSDIAVTGVGTVAGLTVGYDLRAGEPTGVRITNAALKFAFLQGKVDAGPLTPFLTSDTEGDRPAQLPDLPPISLEGLKLTVETDQGTLTAALPGNISLKPDGVVTADSDLSLIHPLLSIEGRIETLASLDGSAQIIAAFPDFRIHPPDVPEILLTGLSLRALVQQDFVDAALSGALPAYASRFDASLSAAGPFDQPTLDLNAIVQTSDLGAVAESVSDLPLRGGTLELQLAFGGGLSEPVSADLAKVLRSMVGDLSLVAEGAVAPDPAIARQFDLRADLSARLDSGQVTLKARQFDLSVDSPVERVALGPLTIAGASHLLTDHVTLSLGPGFQIKARGLERLLSGNQPADVQLAGTIDIGGTVLDRTILSLKAQAGSGISVTGTLSVAARDARQGDLSVGRVDGNIPIHVSSNNDLNPDPEETRFGLLVMEKVSGLPDIRPFDVRAEVRPTFTAGDCSIVVCDPAGIIGTLDARIPDLRITTTDGLTAVFEGLEARMGGLRLLDPVGGDHTGRVKAARVAVPGMVRLTDPFVVVSLPGGNRPMTAHLVAGDIRVEALPPDLSLSTSAEIARTPDGFSYAGAVNMNGPALGLFSFEGDQDVARLRLDPVTATRPFDRAFRLGLISPDDLSGFNGIFDGTARIDLKDQAGIADIVLRDVGLTYQGATIAGLNAALVLSGPKPLTTSGPQSLTIERLDAGLPMTKTAMTYQLSGQPDALRLSIAALSTRLLGGRASFDPFTAGPDARNADLVLNLTAIDLEEASQTAAIEGVNGEGRLSGRLPVQIRNGEQIAVTGGELTSDGPGVLKLPTPLVRDLLGGQAGAELERVLGALANFHYSSLSLKIDKALDGEARVIGRIEGQNPDHDDGQPYVLNVNVQGNADRLLATILSVYNTATGALQGGVGRLQ